jgi:hypothetical protein
LPIRGHLIDRATAQVTALQSQIEVKSIVAQILDLQPLIGTLIVAAWTAFDPLGTSGLAAHIHDPP